MGEVFGTRLRTPAYLKFPLATFAPSRGISGLKQDSPPRAANYTACVSHSSPLPP